MGPTEEENPITGINVTPLVDVCLVLVIIFMVTAPLFMQPVLKIDLPKAMTKEGEEKENVTITISADGRWALNEKEMRLEELSAPLAEKIRSNRDKFVIIRADEGARHAWLLAAMKLSKENGAQSITIATEQKKRK